jgi:type VI secretion system protein ImpC
VSTPEGNIVTVTIIWIIVPSRVSSDGRNDPPGRFIEHGQPKLGTKEEMNPFKKLIENITGSLHRNSGHEANAAKEDEAPANDAQYRIDLRIKEIDVLIEAQLNEIIRHPEFRSLEAVWRGLRYLLQEGGTGEERIRVRMLNATKAELTRDCERALETESSHTFQKIYGDVMATRGKAPIGLLLAAFEFTDELADIRLLEYLSQIAELAFAPIIAAAAPEMLGCRSFDELRTKRDAMPAFSDSFRQAKWKLLRSSESSKFVGLCLPHILLREPYDFSERDKAFNFREDSGKEGSLWGNAAFAFAACVMRSFEQRGAPAPMKGAGHDWQVRGLPANSSEGTFRRRTDADITAEQSLLLSELGFIPLFESPLVLNPVFMNGYPLYEEKIRRPVRSLPYIFAASRIAHYLLAIARDRAGTFRDKELCKKELSAWLDQYTDGVKEEQNDVLRPLRAACLDVIESDAAPAKLRAVVYLSFNNHMLEELPYATRLIIDLP